MHRRWLAELLRRRLCRRWLRIRFRRGWRGRTSLASVASMVGYQDGCCGELDSRLGGISSGLESYAAIDFGADKRVVGDQRMSCPEATCGSARSKRGGGDNFRDSVLGAVPDLEYILFDSRDCLLFEPWRGTPQFLAFGNLRNCQCRTAHRACRLQLLVHRRVRSVGALHILTVDI